MGPILGEAGYETAEKVYSLRGVNARLQGWQIQNNGFVLALKHDRRPEDSVAPVVFQRSFMER
jgi:hypothetical protein